jgi:hypothetical protein
MNEPTTPTPETTLATIVSQSQLDAEDAETLRLNFEKAYELAHGWEIEANAIVVTDASQTDLMKQARKMRLEVAKTRIEVEKSRVALKAASLRKGQAIDAVARVIAGLIAPIEKHLDAQEHFVQIQERLAFERFQAEQKAKADAEAAARAKAEAEEKARLRAENERLQAEAAERDRQAAAERREHERMLAEEQRKAAEAKRAADEQERRAAADRKAAQDLLDQAAAKEAKAARDAEDAAKWAEAEARRREAEAAESAAQEQVREPAANNVGPVLLSIPVEAEWDTDGIVLSRMDGKGNTWFVYSNECHVLGGRSADGHRFVIDIRAEVEA